MNRTQQKPAKVLVPLDVSRFREQVIGAVARFTGADRREVVLLQVVAPVNPAPLLRDDSVARRTLETRYSKANAYLDGVRKRLGLRGVPARTLVHSGDPAEEILGCAKAEGASLIAMSTHGRSGLRRPRATPHVRHLRKYADASVRPEHAFLFRAPNGSLVATANSLNGFRRIVATTDEDVLAYHAGRHDFSRWIRGVFADPEPAAQLRKAGRRWRRGEVADLRGLIDGLIAVRYWSEEL